MAGVKMMMWLGRVTGVVQQFNRRTGSKKGKVKKHPDLRRNRKDEEVRRGKINGKTLDQRGQTHGEKSAKSSCFEPMKK
jgi:hypothetical protein